MADLILSTIPSTLTLTAAGQELVLSVAAGSGEANTVANVGGGDAEVFRDKTAAVLNFRTISGLGSITVAENGDVVEISGGAGGEINTGANVGAGAGVFRDKTGVALNFRTLVGLSGTTVVVNGDVVEITAGGTGDVVGPGASTDNGIARFDGLTGKLLQDSSVTVTDTGIIQAIAIGATPHRLGNLMFGGSGSSVNLIRVLTGALLRLASNAPFELVADDLDDATAVNFTFDGAQEMTTPGSKLISIRNKAAGEKWSVHGTGVVDFTTLDALGGGAAPTFGTIGGTGPTVAAQATWLKIKISGTDHWLPAWV